MQRKGLFDDFPTVNDLMLWYEKQDIKTIPDVNAHIHTPYSFSAFKDIEEAVKQAAEEKVQVLGINDFLVTRGYDEFIEKCKTSGIFPLLNIEFIGVKKDAQENNIRINDPNNPGRIYISGKGLKQNSELSESLKSKLKSVIDAGQDQIAGMINKLNDLLKPINPAIQFSMKEMYEVYAKHLIRERHLATALRVKAEKVYTNESDRMVFYTTLFGSAPKSPLSDFAALENEIRSKLLKAGGKAFIPEEESAFMSLQEINEVILASGGITTYPLLLDDPDNTYTEFEGNKEALLKELEKNNISSIEFIPGRNAIEPLTEYSEFFYNKGFVITYGTEHNAPGKAPIKISCRRKEDLSEVLKEINYRGACVVAAHQFLMEKGGLWYKGYQKDKRDELEDLGDAVINYYFNKK
ncbi:MAG: PHP domain-containing protein [Bacteroidales bacterium]|nr:PHP domain-containing protein [Bacteroidales bacterium]